MTPIQQGMGKFVSSNLRYPWASVFQNRMG